MPMRAPRHLQMSDSHLGIALCLQGSRREITRALRDRPSWLAKKAEGSVRTSRLLSSIEPYWLEYLTILKLEITWQHRQKKTQRNSAGFGITSLKVCCIHPGLGRARIVTPYFAWLPHHPSQTHPKWYVEGSTPSF